MDPAIPTSAPGTYARDADEAEAQPPKVGLATTNEKTTPAIHDDKHDDDGPFSQFCTDNAPIWKLYMDQAKMFDDNLANLFNSDLDPLLIFAGLFSAILAAFLIEIRKGLQEDLQSVTNNLLVILVQNQQNITAASMSANNFTPSASSRWVNGLWFSSLMFSLMSALGASLAKGWITQFSASVSGSSWGDALLHAQRYRGLQRWHLKVVIQCLPIPIHIAFFLFSIGLVILLFQDDIAIGVVISALTGLILSLYIASSTHPVFSPDSPFRTPVSGMLHRLMDRSWRFVLFPPFPDRNDAQKAHALTWLVAESPNVDTVNAAIRAIAGLPANPIVQDALFGDTNAALLLRILSANLLKRSPDNELISSCLYALLHLVQTAHLPSSASKFLQEAVLSGGPLADTDQMPAGLRELAFCVKSRIILLHSAQPLNITLFDDILILIHACSDSHLRRMLIEICILSQQMSKSSASTLDFLAILRNPASVHREQIHGKLVKEASSERYLTDVVASFGAATLVEGLITGSYRTQYAKLFAELTEASAFVKQLAWNGSESTLKLFRTLPVIDENGQRDILRGLHHLITSANGRQVLAIGLPVIIECIDSPNPVLSAEAAQLVNESASHDDLRNVISTSDLSTRLHHIMTTPPSVKHHYTDSFESCSLTLLDAFENLTAGGELHLGIRPELVLSLLLKRIGATMMGYDEPNDIIIRFLQRDNHLALFCVDAVPQIRGMLGDPSWDIQLGTIELLAALVHEDRVRHLLYSPELFPSIVALLHGDGMNFRELSKAVTKMITTLVVHETPLDLDKIEKIVDMVKPDCNVRETLEVIQALAHYDEIRPTMLTLGIMPKILACCKLDYVAHTTLIALVAYDDIRPAISTQMLQMEILAMLKGENTNKTIQRWTMVSVKQLSQYDDFRSSICSPSIVQEIVSLMWHPGPTVDDIREVALCTARAITQHDDPEALGPVSGDTLLNPLVKAVSMLGNEDWEFRAMALHVIAELVQNEKLRAYLKFSTVVPHIITMLEDESFRVGEKALAAITKLCQYDTVPAMIATAADRVVPKVISLLESAPRERIKFSALAALTKFAHHDELCILLSSDQNLLKLFCLLDHPDKPLSQGVLAIFGALICHDNIRRDMFKPEDFTKMLVDARPTKVVAWHCLVCLAEYDDGFRQAICSSETILKRVHMLKDSRQLYLNDLSGVVALARYEDVRVSVCSPEVVNSIFSLLWDQDVTVWRCALEALGSLMKHDEVRQLYPALEMCTRVEAMLAQGASDAEITEALAILSCLQKYPDICPSIFSPYVLEHLEVAMGHELEAIRRAACHVFFGLANHMDFGAMACQWQPQTIVDAIGSFEAGSESSSGNVEKMTLLIECEPNLLPSRLITIVELLTGGSEDKEYLALMQSLIKHDKNDPLVIAGVLAHQILPQIASALPALRDSYRDFIATVVPSSFTPSLEDCKILLSLLSNPDPQILRCGINITLYFAANFQFRRMICQSNFAAVAVEAFRRGATATDTLALITEFAKYEDLRQAMIDLRSGIVQELLTMMKRGTADLDRWQIGLKGIIALNLL